MDIVDAHHHVWRFDKTPWLHGEPVPRIFGPYEPIRRDILIDEFAAEAMPCGVSQSIYVQVNVAPGDELSEINWAADAGTQFDLIQGVTAFADLGSPNVGERLDELASNPRLRGIRQQLHWHTNPAYRFASTANGFLKREWQDGLREVGRRGLVFELQVFVEQFDDALYLVQQHPDTTFVLLHAGMLIDRSSAGWARWSKGMKALSACENLYVKISGLGTFTHSCSVQEWRPVIEETVQSFGPSRCLFGSNFPIEQLWTTYAEIVHVVASSLDGYSESERQRIFAGTARSVYRLPAVAHAARSRGSS